MIIFTSQERIVIIMLSSLLILGLTVKTVKDHYYIGTENLTLIGTNDKIVVFYAQLDEKDIEFASMVNFNSADIEKLISLPGIGKKIAEKIINKRNELGRYNSVKDNMLVPGIGSKTYEKNIFTYSYKLIRNKHYA